MDLSASQEEELTFTPAQLRQARARVAVLHVGGATLSSALSTAGSSAFLLFCTLTIFVKAHGKGPFKGPLKGPFIIYII